MPRIILKTSQVTNAVPGAGSLTAGELAVNTADARVYVGNAAGNPVLMTDSLGRQEANAVTITGGTINSTAITATSVNLTALTLPAERLFYDEGGNAAGNTATWNDATTTTMTEFAGLGTISAHGWAAGPRNYTLTIAGIPAHSEVRYEVFWHLVDSIDNELNQLFTTDSAGTEVLRAQFNKPTPNSYPVMASLASGTTASWLGNRWYSTAPWGGVGRASDNAGGNGYYVFNTGWYTHTASTLIARHYTAVDQPQSDEAVYLSHVKLWIRGTNAFTGIATSAAVDASSTTISTEGAINSYVNNNIRGLVKNVFTYGGSTTYTKTGTDVRRLRVICVGGGGGGRGYGESGGAGGYAERTLDATSITSVSVTVGGGGGGGNYFGYSPQGATTSFGSYVSATGGFGANNHSAHIGGHGGLGSQGDVNSYGGGGKGHNNGVNNPSSSAVGRGGAGFFGGSRNSHHSAPRPADHGAPGGGGTGSVGGNGGSGSDGRTGICIVYELR